jgi:hypothetical protein
MLLKIKEISGNDLGSSYSEISSLLVSTGISRYWPIVGFFPRILEEINGFL